MKQNEREQKKRIKLMKILFEVNFFEKTSSDKVYVNGLNIHESKGEILLNYIGDFELNRSMVVGPIEHRTKIKFRNVDDFESYIKAIDVDYDSDDFTFSGYVYILNTPQFNVVKRCVYALKLLIT